jgi:hypothetical protein
MAKTLRTSGYYTVKAGAGFNGGAGTNTIDLNSRYVRIRGDLTVDGDQIVQNVQNTTIEDQFLEINRNYSGAGAEDSGIVFNQGTEDDAVFYYDGTANEFRIGTTGRAIADGSTVKWIIDGGAFSLANIKVATTPTDANHAASRSYVDAQVGGAANTGDITFTGSTISGPSNADVTITSGGTGGIVLDDAIRIRQNHIEGTRSNDDILIQPSGTGAVVIQDVLTFEANASTPTAGTITKIYSKTAAGGGTGVFFNNSNISSGTEGELISKKKATALAIALG